MSAPLPWFAGSAVAGVLLALAGQAIAPMHVLGHAASQQFVVVAAIHLLCSPAMDWARTLSGSLAMVAAFALSHWILGGVNGCNPANTQLFLWATWMPLALFFTAVRIGVPIGRRRAGVFVLCVLGTLAHDGLQQLFAAQTVDPFVGVPLFLNQRADMEVPRIHLLSRAWLLCVSLALTLAVHVRSHPGLKPAAFVAGLLALGATFAGSHLGVGPGPAAIRQALPRVHSTENFDLRYAPMGDAAVRIEAIAREAEFRYHQLEEAWGTNPGRVELLVFDSTAHLREHTGMEWAHATFGRAAIPWWDGLDATLGHELVHVFHPSISWHPGLTISPGLLEGTAMAFDDRAFAWTDAAHAEVAAASEQGNLPAAYDLLHPLGFAAVNESNAYRFAGSFMGFLVRVHGIERFLQAQRTLDFEGTYGRDLTGLDQDWRAWLATIPRSKTQTARARDRYDPARAPGFFDHRCPKLGTAEPGLEERAKAWSDKRAWDGAEHLYGELYEQQPDRRWIQGAVGALQGMGRHGDALQWLEKDAAREKTEDQALVEVNRRIVSLLADGHWTQLYAAFDLRRTLEPAPSERVHLERMLRREEIRERLGPILLAHDPSRAREVLVQLQVEFPEEPGWDVLLASRASPVPGRRRALHRGAADHPERWTGWIDWVASAGTCEADELERGFLHLLDLDACVPAESLLRAMAANCVEGKGLVAAGRSRRRWDWAACGR